MEDLMDLGIPMETLRELDEMWDEAVSFADEQFEDSTGYHAL